MKDDREACCTEKGTRCGTRFEALRKWSCRVTGKGVRLVKLEGDKQGKPPFYAQPVGYDGRTILVGWDHGCDTEKLLHEVCHWLVAPRERRGKVNYGLGPGTTPVDPVTSDNEEVTVMLLERLLAPHFALPESRIARPDYNVHDRRNVDWDDCQTRAETLLEPLKPTLAELFAPRAKSKLDSEKTG